jgi:hypothetical protein
VKRTSGYPSFLIFDGSDRATSLARRIPTNTPLQALVTLNDPVYDEAAQALAARVTKDIGGKVSDTENALDLKLAYEARLVLSRDATPQELSVLRGLYEMTTKAPTGPVLTRASMKSSAGVSVGSAQRDFKALKAVASVLLNMDAALTR